MFQLLALGSIVLFVTSCADKASESSAPEENAFTGTWKNNCTTVAGNTSLQTTYSFGSDKTVDIELNSFSDTECNTKAHQLTSKYTYAVVSDGEQSSKNVEFTLVAAKNTYFEDSAVALANSMKMCGIDTWTKDLTVDCTDKPAYEGATTEESAGYKNGQTFIVSLKLEGEKLTNLTTETTFNKQ